MVEYAYVCWRCRHVSTKEGYGADQFCTKGHHMQYVGGRSIPKHRDDHKMWQLAEEKLSSDRHRRTRQRPRRARVRIADWERELLKAAR